MFDGLAGRGVARGARVLVEEHHDSPTITDRPEQADRATAAVHRPSETTGAAYVRLSEEGLAAMRRDRGPPPTEQQESANVGRRDDDPAVHQTRAQQAEQAAQVADQATTQRTDRTTEAKEIANDAIDETRDMPDDDDAMSDDPDRVQGRDRAPPTRHELPWRPPASTSSAIARYAQIANDPARAFSSAESPFHFPDSA